LNTWTCDPEAVPNALKGRYTSEDALNERVSTLRLLLEESRAFFDANASTSVVASSGRCRIFMGHTDFNGLGGFTIDCATKEEIIGIAQKTSDGMIHLRSTSSLFQATSFPVAEVCLQDRPLAGPAVWDQASWASYIKGALALMLSTHFPSHRIVRAALNVDHYFGSVEVADATVCGMNILLSNSGPLGLSPGGGFSSSGALTGAFSLCLDHLYRLHLSRDHLCLVDYGEFFLGKQAGAADKTAQLHASLGSVIAVGSHPECFLKAVEFPRSLSVMTVIGPIPRLTTTKGVAWLKANFAADHAAAALEWAEDVMFVNSARAYVEAVTILTQQLKEGTRIASANISPEEASAVLAALEGSGPPLLRELCTGGSLARKLPSHTPRQMAALTYKLLSLVPVSVCKTRDTPDGPRNVTVYPRRAALYGISEIERGAAYMDLVEAAKCAEQQTDNGDAVEAILMRLMEVVQLAHDGDKAFRDYRCPSLPPTEWAGSEMMLCSDESLASWIQYAEDPHAPASSWRLAHHVGAFERSLPDVDDVATELLRDFHGQAAMRVSAAGLSAMACVHCLTSLQAAVSAWFKRLGWECIPVSPGAGTRVLCS